MTAWGDRETEATDTQLAASQYWSEHLDGTCIRRVDEELFRSMYDRAIATSFTSANLGLPGDASFNPHVRRSMSDRTAIVRRFEFELITMTLGQQNRSDASQLTRLHTFFVRDHPFKDDVADPTDNNTFIVDRSSAVHNLMIIKAIFHNAYVFYFCVSPETTIGEIGCSYLNVLTSRTFGNAPPGFTPFFRRLADFELMNWGRKLLYVSPCTPSQDLHHH